MEQGFEYNYLSAWFGMVGNWMIFRIQRFWWKFADFENFLCEKIIYKEKNLLLCYPEQHVAS